MSLNLLVLKLLDSVSVVGWNVICLPHEYNEDLYSLEGGIASAMFACKSDKVFNSANIDFHHKIQCQCKTSCAKFRKHAINISSSKYHLHLAKSGTWN